jgi:hypothetical protein
MRESRISLEGDVRKVLAICEATPPKAFHTRGKANERQAGIIEGTFFHMRESRISLEGHDGKA